MCLRAKLLQSCPTLCNPMDCGPWGSSVHGILQAKKTGMGCHSLLQGIFPIQGSNPCLYVSVSCIGRRAPYHKHHMESPESAIHISIYVYTIYLYRWIPSFLSFPLLSPFPAHLTPLGHPRAPSWASCDIQRFPASYLFYTWYWMNVNATLSIRPTLFGRGCVYTSAVYICISIKHFEDKLFILESCSVYRKVAKLALCPTVSIWHAHRGVQWQRCRMLTHDCNWIPDII